MKLFASLFEVVLVCSQCGYYTTIKYQLQDPIYLISGLSQSRQTSVGTTSMAKVKLSKRSGPVGIGVAAILSVMDLFTYMNRPVGQPARRFMYFG